VKQLFPLYGIRPFIVIYLLFIAIEAFIFGPYLWRPNDFVFAFGGDALVIYYDMIYHICHGNGGLHFEGMNYPFGESLLMTDANAAFTYILYWINKVIPICHMVPGILHGLILYLLPLTGIYLFLILRKLEVSSVLAIIFSVLVAFLSPQMLRILGHFGLAFPFVIPMAIYWVLTYEPAKSNWTREIIYATAFLFFFLNNPYLGFAGLALITAFALVQSFGDKKIHFRPFVMGVLPALIGYLLIQWSDPFNDRVEMQWGFFHFFANIQGMFYPNGSLLYDLLAGFKIPDVRFEGRINVGLVTTIVTIAGLVALGKRIITRKMNPLFRMEGQFKYLMWASFLLFLYAANYSLYGFAKPFMEEYLGKLLMFKASGRMAWPFYFMLTIYTTVVLGRLYQKPGMIYQFVVAAAIMIWGYEAMQFNIDRFTNVHHSNPFAQKDFERKLMDLHINTSTYEALYMLPVVQSWNDKYYFNMHFESQFSGTMISANTGIPMINATLSRAPMQSTLESIQLAAAPHIKRERFYDLKGDRPILVVLGNNHPTLTKGEQYVLDQATPVGEFANCTLYSLDSRAWKVAPPPPDSTLLLKDNFENTANTFQGMRGGKSIQSAPDTGTLWQGKLDSNAGIKSIEVSIWHYLDPASYHLPEIRVSCDPDDRNFFNRSSRDVIEGWTRHSVVVPFCEEISITVTGEKEFLFDNLEIRMVE
jgi:hypothetical protein